MPIVRKAGVAMVGAIAFVLVSPALEARIFPSAGTAYIAPPAGYNLNIRSGPGTQYPAVNTLRRGTPIAITGYYEHGWAQLSDRSWVAGNFISSIPVGGVGGGGPQGVPATAVIIGSSNVNIRNGPGTRYPVVNTLAPGTAIRITGFYEHGWAQLEDRSWVAGNLIQIGGPIAPPPVVDNNLRVGSTGQRVLEVEVRLRELGYFTNDFVPDTSYGTDTEQAVRNFQIRNGLPVTGVVDDATNTRLFSAEAIRNPDQSPVYKELRNGDRDPAVATLERRLQNLNYFQGQIPDNTYDNFTEAAVRNFQDLNSLPINGVATVPTQERLYSDNALPNSGDGDNSPVYEELRNGDRDPAVATLERRLQNLNYFQGQAPDNTYDNFTEAAVRNFQDLNSLLINGVATVPTQERLYSNAAVPNSDNGGNPVPPAGSGQQATVTTPDGTAAIAFTGPGFEYGLAGDVPNGTVVTLTGREDRNWYELQDGRWVYGDYLTFN
ncbi:MAG: peptidoglycan-binding protein [Cyanobacteria bacterium P01_C01_bin.120]